MKERQMTRVRQMLFVATMLAFGGGQLAAAQRAELGSDGRRVIRSKRNGDTIPLKSQQTNFVLEDAVVQASPRTAIIFFDHQGAHSGTLIRNVLIHVAPKTLELGRAYWAVRGYDMDNSTFDNVEITGFGRLTPKHDEGHAMYLNLVGGLTISSCYIHHNGGQGLQLVNRPHESSLPRGPATGEIHIRNSRYHENGFSADRGSFQIAIYGTGQPILIQNVEILAGQDGSRYQKGKTRGGLVIEPEWRPPGKKSPWWYPPGAPKDYQVPFTQGRTELNGVTIRHKNPDRPLAQIKGCEELIVTGCTFDGGKISLDLPDMPGRDSGSIIWKGNTGDATVFHRGKALGPVSEDFVIKPKEAPKKKAVR
jgi:hypothetical protein